MGQNRKGETGGIPFRTGRFFSVSGQWFFASREGVDHGPYLSRPEAEKALSNFLNDVETTGLFDQRYTN